MPANAGPSIIRDTEIESILKDWTKDVFRQAGLDSSQVDIILVQSPEINAFVAGGSNIFIYTGLINKTETPEELIGVIAHETGHIAGGHLVRTRRAMENASYESILATILGVGAAIAGGGGDAATAGMAIGQASSMNSFLSHSRVQESSADQAGLRFLTGAGIAPAGLVTFLEKINKQELLPATQQSAYMRTHPLSRDRIETLKHTLSVSKFALKPQPAAWNDQHARLKAKLLAFISPQQISRVYPSSDNSTPALYARAIAAYRQSRTAESLSMIDALIKREPNNPYFYELKGQVLFEAGEAKDSLAPYQKSLSLAPRAGLIRTALAQSLIDTDNFAKAIDELKQAERDEPRSSYIKRLLATAAGKMGSEAEAKVYLAEEALLQNRDREAEALATAALKTLPTSSPARLRAQDVISLSQGGKKPE